MICHNGKLYLFYIGEIIMDDLLKDAIADAKAVRETALANAKIALEEAFTPRIQSMLSQKIQSEMEGEEEVDGEEPEAEEAPEIAVEPEVGEPEAEFAEDDIDPTDEFSEEPAGEEPAGEEEFEVEEDEEFGEEPVADEAEGDVIEINGVKYAPIVSEEDEEALDEPEFEEDGEEDELDLEAILSELEDDEEELEEEYHEGETGDGLDSSEVETADEAELAEDLQDSSGIGAGDNKVDDDSNDSSDTGAQGPEGEGSDAEAGKEDDNLEVVDDLVEVNGVKYSPISEDDEYDEEDIDLEEILRALSEGDDEAEEEESAVAELKSVKSDLKEHRDVVKYLRSKLNEVNLLNAKLLFTNKLFRSYGLNNNQKLKVVETFDRARNLREVKLVFSTLAESFGNTPSKTTIKESKGSASKAVASTKPKSKKVIGEGFDMKKRFQKLANIL